jgi:hypothetical protein
LGLKDLVVVVVVVGKQSGLVRVFLVQLGFH